MKDDLNILRNGRRIKEDNYKSVMQGIRPPFFDKLKTTTQFLLIEDNLNFVIEGIQPQLFTF